MLHYGLVQQEQQPRPLTFGRLAPPPLHPDPAISQGFEHAHSDFLDALRVRDFQPINILHVKYVNGPLAIGRDLR